MGAMGPARLTSMREDCGMGGDGEAAVVRVRVVGGAMRSIAIRPFGGSAPLLRVTCVVSLVILGLVWCLRVRRSWCRESVSVSFVCVCVYVCLS